MFAIHTNHAADLQRHIDGFIFWSRNAVFLSWIGFSDIHSGISHYVLTIGSTYMATDLNKVGILSYIFESVLELILA